MAWFATVIAIPAFFLNLGLSPIIGDEGIRTLVALEMKLSGNFLVPTMNGDLYLNKPPLYNWLIYIISESFNEYGEWPSRCLTLIFLGLFAISVYHWNKKYPAVRFTLVLPLMLLTSGRILFWDSQYGLIDICFSWVIYMNFMTLYHFGKADRWNALFLISYALCSVAFLLKGLPALVFQFASMISTLWFFGKLQSKLFSLQHFALAIIGLLPAITYYFAYMTFVSLDNAFSVLLDQSMQRTASHHGLFKTIVHFFTFPFEQIYHFLPWSVLIILTFQKQFLKTVKQHPFIYFNALMLLVNIPVYWLSVEVYPRYLLMFIPLFNTVVIYFYELKVDQGEYFGKRLHVFFKSASVLMVVGSVGILWYEQLSKLANVYWIFIGSFLGLTLLLIPLWKYSNRWIFWFAVFMLGSRIVYDVTILPVVAYRGHRHLVREDAQRLHNTYPQKNWYVFDSTETHMIARFYTAKFHQQVIHRVNEVKDPDPNGLYIVDLKKFPLFPGIKTDSLIIESGERLAIMQPLYPLR